MTIPSSVCALVAGLTIVFLALCASRHARDDDHFVSGCDRFGYERMARAIREARAAGTPADYFLHDEQARWLVSRFKASDLPVGRWDEAVTPLAYHYFPGTDQVGPQYPPGTGWMLSLFAEPDDVRSLDLWTIWLVAAGGLGLLARNAWRGLTLSSFLVAGAAAALLAPYGWAEGESYSISATIGPLSAGTVLAWLATRVRDRRAAVALGVAAGLCFGLLISIRLASALLAPAAALLFASRRLWPVLPGYAAGAILTGVLPVLLHNRTITGHLLGTTYNKGDLAQTLGSLAANFRFYFARYAYDTGVLHLAGLAIAILAWLTVVSATRPRGALLRWRGWLAGHPGLPAAILCAVGLSTAYFLTHAVVIYYYLTPAMLLACLLLALLGTTLEERWQEAAGPFVDAGKPPAVAMGAAVFFALLALAFGHRFLHHLASSAFVARGQPPPGLTVPPPMLDPHAWIWADYLSGSVCYYTGHPAFKITFTSPDMRQSMYGWVQSRGEPQYLVADTDLTKPFVDEARAAGWRLTPVGEIREAVCYRMEKP